MRNIIVNKYNNKSVKRQESSFTFTMEKEYKN